MWKRCRSYLLLVALINLAFAVYFEPTRCVRGWLQGEAFFEGRPTSYWANEIEQWQVVTLDGEGWGGCDEYYARRPQIPAWLRRFVNEPKRDWPRLLDGDADALAVLVKLREHPSEHVRDWARIGVERIHNDERGPTHRRRFMGELDDF